MEDFLIRDEHVWLNHNWREDGVYWWYACTEPSGCGGMYLSKKGRWTGTAYAGSHNVALFTTREACLEFARKFQGINKALVAGEPYTLHGAWSGGFFACTYSNGKKRYLNKSWSWVTNCADKDLMMVKDEDELEQLWAEHNNPELQAQRAAERKARLIACGWED